jgi:sialic acid synthase SpsE
MGNPVLGCNTAEKDSLAYRRSLYVAKNVKAGEVFTKENLRAVRPGFGLAPELLPTLLGRRATQDLCLGMPMKLEFVQD